jgi:hypothetical protein
MYTDLRYGGPSTRIYGKESDLVPTSVVNQTRAQHDAEHARAVCAASGEALYTLGQQDCTAWASPAAPLACASNYWTYLSCSEPKVGRYMALTCYVLATSNATADEYNVANYTLACIMVAAHSPKHPFAARGDRIAIEAWNARAYTWQLVHWRHVLSQLGV